MENTCVLSSLPVIPNWKVYNLPPKRHIQYYFILKQKREFQSLMENVFISEHLKSSCTVFDKKECASKNERQLKVVFLNEINKSALLSLDIFLNVKYALKRRNHLLVFLKNTKKDIKYQIQNGSIYIKCEIEVQWEIFYKLFEFLLLRYGWGVIGATFYKSIVVDCMIVKEKMTLCNSPLKTNSLQSLSKKAQQKHSKFAKSKLNNSCDEPSQDILFNWSEKCSRTISLCEQDLKHKEYSLNLLKRKSTGFGYMTDKNSQKRKVCKLNHCLCEKMKCKCHETEWTQFRNLSNYVVHNYMDILLSKGVFDEVELSSSQESKVSNSTSHQISNSSFNDTGGKTFISSTLATCAKSNSSGNLPESEKLLNTHMTIESATNVSRDKNSIKKSNSNTQQSFQNITNISEKVIGKSNSDTQKAFQNSPNVSQTENLIENSVNYLKGNKSSTMVDNTLMNIENPNTEVLEEKENISLLFNEFAGDNFGDQCEFDAFKTASGKKINISTSALKAAEKMLADTNQSDKASFLKNNNIRTKIHESSFNRGNLLSVNSKHNTPQLNKEPIKEQSLDESIDGALAEKIFEEMSFDDKEIVSSSNMLPMQSSSAFIENTCSKLSSVGKVRKSLGGRRSLKPYSAPKP